MKGPLFEFGFLGEGGSLIVALVVGVCFGWFLERGGMGDARKLAAQFYGRDLAVFKLMFSAMITAMLGVFWLARLGWIEPGLIFVPPTWVVPQALGGLIFGAGFVVGGLCPGTSCVALSSGRKDGLALLAGLFVGIFLFGEALPFLGSFNTVTARGTLTLPDVLALPYPWVVAFLTVLAVAIFTGVETLERRRERRPVAGARSPEGTGS